jgi:hypothetical protein
MGLSNVYYFKTRWFSKIPSRYKRGKQSDQEEAISSPKNLGYATKTGRLYVCNISGFKYGTLPHETYTSFQQAMYDLYCLGKNMGIVSYLWA